MSEPTNSTISKSLGFFDYWLENRKKQFKNNYKELNPDLNNKEISAILTKDKRNIKQTPYIITAPSNPSYNFSSLIDNQGNPAELTDVKHFLDDYYNNNPKVTSGTVVDPNLSRDYVFFKNTPTFDEVFNGIIHANDFSAQEAKIKSILGEGYNPKKVYKELMQIRYDNRLSPNYKVDEGDLGMFQGHENIRKGKGMNSILHKVDKEKLLQLFNDVAYNDQQSENQDIAYAKKGKKLMPKRNVKKCGFGDSLRPAAKAASGLLPIVGTYQDYKTFKENPTWSNAGWLATSALGDVLTLTGVGAGAGAALKATKAARLANATADAANTIRKTSNVLDSMADAGKTLNKSIDLTQKARVGNDLINNYTNA